MKKSIFILLALLAFPHLSYAAKFGADDHVNVDKAVTDDLYVAGNEIRVRSTIEGDLFMGGNEVILDGEVSEDVFAGGKNVTLTGLLKDDLRAAGESIRVESKVEDDVMLAGQNITIEESSGIGGDFLFAGSVIRLEAPVKGDLKGTGESIYINSQVEGDVTIYNSGKLTFGPKGKIIGNLTYSSLSKAEIPAGVVTGKVIFKEKSTPSKEGMEGVMAGFSLYGLLSSLFFGLILIGAARHFSLHNSKRAMESPFKSMGIGFLLLISVPAASFLLIFTVIGIPLSLILFAIWLVILYVGTILAAILMGGYLVKVDEKSSFLRLLGSFSLGALLLTVLSFIPFFGWALRFLVVLIALGGLFLGQMDRFSELRGKKLI